MKPTLEQRLRRIEEKVSQKKVNEGRLLPDGDSELIIPCETHIRRTFIKRGYSTTIKIKRGLIFLTLVKETTNTKKNWNLNSSFVLENIDLNDYEGRTLIDKAENFCYDLVWNWGIK